MHGFWKKKVGPMLPKILKRLTGSPVKFKQKDYSLKIRHPGLDPVPDIC
jgi:hypothetical protein